MLQQDTASATAELSYLVGIGASAGGLEALQDFFQQMPADTNMAFVVIQHLSSDYKSVMDELLQKHTTMAIEVVQQTTPIRPNHVYLISSKSNLIIEDHQLAVLDKDPQQRLNLPIDLFFHSLGEAYSERAVGVVLSGTGTDGSRGAKTIKEHEGLLMVQNPEEARFDGMPNAIVSQGIADFVLGAKELAAELARLAYHAPWLKSQPASAAESGPGSAQILKRILFELKKQCKIDFALYREQTIYRRLAKRIRVLNLASIEDYYYYLVTHSDEARRLVREFLIGVTRFFRDSEAWELIKDQVLPEICANREPDQPLRIWVSSCSTGEEAYSLAILVHEYLHEHQLKLDFKLFATDIDEDAILFAGHGRYPESVFTSISSERLYRYFDKDGDSYVIKKSIRDHLVFARHNLLTDPPFLKQDLISCRNMLLYVQPEAQRKILSTLHFALRLGGFLFMGKSESLGSLSRLFRPVNQHLNIFQNIEAAKSHQMLLEHYWTQERGEGRQRQPQPLRREERPPDNRFYEDTLLSEFVPTSLFVDRHGEVLYAHGKTHPYIMFPRGRVSYGLKSMLKDEELTLIQSGMQRALQSKQTIRYQSVPLERGPESLRAHISIRALWHPQLEQDVFLLEFQPVAAESGEVVQVQSTDFVQEQMNALRLDVQQKATELSSLREKLETSNEELQASNEELLASNEELQSTNEELQSVNEELYTVNSELEAKLRNLAELNNDLNNFLNSTQIGLIFLDQALNIRRFTPSIRQVFNLYETDVGRSISHFTLRFDQPLELERIAARVLLDGKVYEQQVSVAESQEYILRVLPYLTLDQRVEGVVLSLVNVSELRAYQQRLQNEAAKLQGLIDSSSDLIAALDQDYRLIVANRAFEDFLRHWLGFEGSVAELDLEHFASADSDQQQLYRQLRAGWSKALGGETSESEVLLSLPDGSTPLFQLRMTQLHDGGERLGAVLVLRDVTSERAAERGQQQAMDELRRANAYLDSFVYAAAHDLRSPIANLISILERMQRKPAVAAEPMFPLLERSVHSLDQTLGGLIEIIDVQKMSDQAARPVSFEHLLELILLHYPDLQGVDQQALVCDFEVASLCFIEPYLQSILLNLVDNAVKYRHPERPLALRLETRRDPDGLVRLRVCDNGIGLPSKLSKAKLFRAFQRYHTEVDGKGIGLYLVKTLVEKNGGWVDVEARPEGGTCFILGLREYEQRAESAD